MFVVTQRQLMPMYLVFKIIQPREFVFLLVRTKLGAVVSDSLLLLVACICFILLFKMILHPGYFFHNMCKLD